MVSVLYLYYITVLHIQIIQTNATHGYNGRKILMSNKNIIVA